VLGPAQGYAADGFPASPTLAGSIPRIRDLPGAKDFAAGPVKPGTIIRRPGVARTLEAIGAGGRKAFYEGEFGEGLLKLGHGEYTDADLARLAVPYGPWQGYWAHYLRAAL